MKLEITKLRKSFDKKVVLNDAEFTFESGKIYALLGRNGAGKTTFFNCLSDDIKSDAKEIKFKSGEDERNNLKQTDIGYVVSTPIVPEFLTGREFLRFVMDVNELQRNDKIIDEYFILLDIDEEDRDKIMKNYSHGMKNKMQMIANMITNPNILLLDEPLTSFDVVMAEQFKKLLKDMKENHIIIFSTHILELAIDLCDEIVLLHNGKLNSVLKDELHEADLKEKIIEMLKDENNVE